MTAMRNQKQKKTTRMRERETATDKKRDGTHMQ